MVEVFDVEAKDDSVLEGTVERDSERDRELALSLARDNLRLIWGMYVRFFAFSMYSLSSGLNRLRFDSNSESSELNELPTTDFPGLVRMYRT